MGRHSKRRIPKLSFTNTQDIGWHVNYRDPVSGVPRRKRFGLIEKDEASAAYTSWLSDHLTGKPQQTPKAPSKTGSANNGSSSDTAVQPGSLMHVAPSYLFYEEKRTRKHNEPRRAGTISPSVFAEHKYDVEDFLKFIKRRYGPGSAGKLSILDLKMQDVEAYNAELVEGVRFKTFLI